MRAHTSIIKIHFLYLNSFTIVAVILSPLYRSLTSLLLPLVQSLPSPPSYCLLIYTFISLFYSDHHITILLSSSDGLFTPLLTFLLSLIHSIHFIPPSFYCRSTDEQLQEMTSPANYNRYKEISRPNVNKIVKLGMAFRGTHVTQCVCVWLSYYLFEIFVWGILCIRTYVLVTEGQQSFKLFQWSTQPPIARTTCTCALHLCI